MMPPSTIFQILIPEFVLGIGGMALLIFGVLSKTNKFTACVVGAVFLLLVTAAFVIATPATVLFGGLFQTSNFTQYVDLLILLGAAAALILAVDYNQRQGIARFEYPVLVLFATLGMLVMVSAGDLMTLYLGLELQSLSLYICAALARDELRSTEAGLKYFVLGALASGLLVYGISLVYGFGGTTNFAALSHVLISSKAAGFGTVIGIVFVLVGLAFKLSAAPFHMWTPDVYEGAPTSVTALFGTAPKVAAMALLLSVMLGPFGHLLSQWQMLIEILAVISMLLGSLAAIGQTNIKRLMAYSSIGHMGFALVGLAAGTPDGVHGVIVYMSIYLLMTLGTFAAILSMQREGHYVENIADLAGLARTNGPMAFFLGAMMFSLAGIPPLAGFFAKFYVFAAAIQANLFALAVIGVLCSVVGAFYYLRIVKIMYFDEPAKAFDQAGVAARVVLALSTALIIFYAIAPAPLTDAAMAAAKSLF
jgi:NADH-quinone oxidoreductase subunit N